MKTATLNLPDGQTLSYQIRLSRRAKYMRLTFSSDKGLVVTQPAYVSTRELGQWIHSKLDWISQNLERTTARNLALGKNQPLQRPDAVELPLLGKTIQVKYQPDKRQEISIDYTSDTLLTLSGMTDDTEFCVSALQKWLQGYANIPLGDLLHRTAQQTGFSYKSYRVKAQRTRWGSCSNRGNINLNYKLILMPMRWAHYTVVHELCHTVEMNHSKRFWALVGQFVPDYQTIHAEMKEASLALPNWVNASVRG